MKDGGFFKQEGLDVDLVYIPSSSVVARAMLAGEAAISTANSQVVVDSGLQGSDLVIIGGAVNVAAFYIMAVPEIRSVQDLKGKPVGITRFSASTDFSLRMLLKEYGLEPVRDVPILQIGGMPEIAAALSKKDDLRCTHVLSNGLRSATGGHEADLESCQRRYPFCSCGNHHHTPLYAGTQKPGKGGRARLRLGNPLHAHQERRFQENHGAVHQGQ